MCSELLALWSVRERFRQTSGWQKGKDQIMTSENLVYVLRKGDTEYARCPRIGQMRAAIWSEVRLGRMTDSNFDEWRISVEEFADGVHLSSRRNPTPAEIVELEPWGE
jgi:hypothetical protein